MTESAPVTARQKAVDRYLRAANIGTATIIAYPILSIFTRMVIPDASSDAEPNVPLVFGWLAIGLLFIVGQFYSFFHLFFRRNADEFTLAMWQTGTTVAFFAIVAWLLVGGTVEDLFQGMIYAEIHQSLPDGGDFDAAAKDAEQLDIVERFSLPIALASFFVGLQYKRVRGF